MIFQPLTPHSSKADWRRWARAQRKGLDWQALSPLMLRHLRQSQVFQQARSILVYWPKPDAEPDLTPLLKEHPEKCWYLPSLQPDQQIHPSRYQWPAPLRWVSPPGVYEPLESSLQSSLVEPSSLDLALVPVLAADESGIRLGHGAGAYDRWWGGLSESQRPCVLLAVPQALRVSALPQESWDLRANGLLSETGLHWL